MSTAACAPLKQTEQSDEDDTSIPLPSRNRSIPMACKLAARATALLFLAFVLGAAITSHSGNTPEDMTKMFNTTSVIAMAAKKSKKKSKKKPGARVYPGIYICTPKEEDKQIKKGMFKLGYGGSGPSRNVLERACVNCGKVSFLYQFKNEHWMKCFEHCAQSMMGKSGEKDECAKKGCRGDSSWFESHGKLWGKTFVGNGGTEWFKGDPVHDGHAVMEKLVHELDPMDKKKNHRLFRGAAEGPFDCNKKDSFDKDSKLKKTIKWKKTIR